MEWKGPILQRERMKDEKLEVEAEKSMDSLKVGMI